MNLFSIYIGILKYYLQHIEVRITLIASLLLPFLAYIIIDPGKLQSTRTVLTFLEIRILTNYAVYCLLILLLAFLFQRIEYSNTGKSKFAWLPVDFKDIFFCRLLAMLSISLVYWTFSILLLYLFFQQAPTHFIFTYTCYLTLPLLAYLLIATFRSFFVNTIVFGIVELLVYFISGFLSFLKYSPFSLGYRTLHIYHTRNMYPDSILTNSDLMEYIWLSVVYNLALLSFILVFSRKANFLTKSIFHE